MNILFNTLEYTKGAEAVGIKREHAEYQAEQIAKLVDNNIATKKDVLLLKDQLKNEMVKLEQRLTIKLGGMMVVSTTLTITILGFIFKT